MIHQAFNGSYSTIQENKELILKEEKIAQSYSEAQTEQRVFHIADIYIAKNEDEILIACNINEWDLHNSSQTAYIK